MRCNVFGTRVGRDQSVNTMNFKWILQLRVGARKREKRGARYDGLGAKDCGVERELTIPRREMHWSLFQPLTGLTALYRKRGANAEARRQRYQADRELGGGAGLRSGAPRRRRRRRGGCVIVRNVGEG